METLPEHLGHKPVFAMHYENFDGTHGGHTDAKYLSIGLAQYDANSVSAKIMRHNGNRWTRQAEEMPLHRVIDLTLFLASALFSSEDGHIEIPAGTFDSQDEDLDVSQDGKRSNVEVARFYGFLEEHGDHLNQRLNALTDTLIGLRESGRL